MNVEEIARRHEIERTLEDNREKWTREGNLEDKKRIRFYQQDKFRVYSLWAALSIATAAFCAYTGYKIVNSGAKIIDRHIDNISVFYLDEN